MNGIQTSVNVLFLTFNANFFFSHPSNQPKKGKASHQTHLYRQKALTLAFFLKAFQSISHL